MGLFWSTDEERIEKLEERLEELEGGTGILSEKAAKEFFDAPLTFLEGAIEIFTPKK